jgi:hypothetical protein
MTVHVLMTLLNSNSPTLMLVGSTKSRLSDVQLFNKAHNANYALNVNDCRHYANSLVQLCTGALWRSCSTARCSCVHAHAPWQHVTCIQHHRDAHAGVPNATSRLVQHNFLQRRSHSPRVVDRLVPPAQHLTNPDNWAAVQQSLHALGVAALLSLSHPVLLPPLASSTAVAAAALHSALGGNAARLAAAAAVLTHRTALHKRTLLSTLAVARGSQRAHRRDVQAGAHRPLCRLRTVGDVIGHSVSRGAMHAHKTAGRLAASVGMLADPIRPLRHTLSAQVACITRGLDCGSARFLNAMHGLVQGPLNAGKGPQQCLLAFTAAMNARQ